MTGGYINAEDIFFLFSWISERNMHVNIVFDMEEKRLESWFFYVRNVWMIHFGEFAYFVQSMGLYCSWT